MLTYASFIQCIRNNDISMNEVMSVTPQLAAGSVDHVTAIASYYIAAAGLLLTIAALLATGTGFYFSVKHSAALKSVEVEQKKFENALDLVRIVAGFRYNFSDGKHSTFLQIAALESLANYPEFHELYAYMARWYATTDLSDQAHREIHAAAVRLARRTKPNSRFLEK